jgi:heat shock protein HtpX
VCINEGLLELLDADELEGVLAHELSHVYRRDVLLGTIAATLAAAVTSVARLGVLFGGDEEHPNPVTALLLLLATPVVAVLLQLAVSRSRETAADTAGALLCRKPLALASALAKIEAGADVRRRAGHTAAEASPAFGSLYIAAPLGGTGGLHQLVATHPPTAERIRRLEALAARRPRIGRGHHQRLVEVVGLGTDGAAAGSPRAGVG